jgi:hypothetical protein
MYNPADISIFVNLIKVKTFEETFESAFLVEKGAWIPGPATINDKRQLPTPSSLNNMQNSGFVYTKQSVLYYEGSWNSSP